VHLAVRGAEGGGLDLSRRASFTPRVPGRGGFLFPRGTIDVKEPRDRRNNTRDGVNRAVNILRLRLRLVAKSRKARVRGRQREHERSTRINVLFEQGNRFQVGVPRAERAARHIYIIVSI